MLHMIPMAQPQPPRIPTHHPQPLDSVLSAMSTITIITRSSMISSSF
tara:strand:+ start:3954 stop:4094 length:141 start_codon:yes stop_codon:yes gene_type:complete